MAAQPQCSEAVREQREAQTDGGDLNSETRKVQKTGNALYANLTEFGVKTHNLSAGDTVTIRTFSGGIWIDTSGGEDA